MSVNISYMGTKRELAPKVADVIRSAKSGIAFDVFAGMCSVAEAVSSERSVWTNDIQYFAYLVGFCLFSSKTDPLDCASTSNLYFDNFLKHRERISGSFKVSLQAEDELIQIDEFSSFEIAYANFQRKLSIDIHRFNEDNFTFFTRFYSDSYFGLRQAIEIDAVSASVRADKERNAESEEGLRWAIVAMGRSALRISNSTGHFAQYLKPKEKSFKVFVRQRRRSFWDEFLTAIDDLSPVGSRAWRTSNRSFNRDTLNFLPDVISMIEKPSVIYADPPYTDDQYSRFYHVLETLALYDSPLITGQGRYRAGRFRTPFSIKSSSAEALDNLAKATAEIGADFVLSYPTNGLIYQRGLDPQSIVAAHFKTVECRSVVEHTHSTFGASKGPSKHNVIEQLFLARNP